MNGVLALRFDVDSITCIERGIPKLEALADDFGVRFTFFVNMGYSFNHRLYLSALSKRGQRRGASGGPRSALPVLTKLGVPAALRTILFNPRLGDRYRATFDRLAADGHELGLHGGTDHAAWQRSLETLDAPALEALFRPAFETFRTRYDQPRGFASPGFVYNDLVLDLLDREGFEYASDMPGEEPFVPGLDAGDGRTHYQVPVNVLGSSQVPIVEEGLARGLPHDQIVASAAAMIRERRFALMYGHPYVEGVHDAVLRDVLSEVRDTHQIVPVRDYLQLWRSERDG